MDAHIGRRLRLRRVMMGLSQEDVALELGIAFQQVQKYECALTRISAGRPWAMAATLRCPVSFFYQGLGQYAAPTDGEADGAVLLSRGDAQALAGKQETLKLIRAYSSIKDLRTRRTLYALASSLGKAARGQASARPLAAPGADRA